MQTWPATVRAILRGRRHAHDGRPCRRDRPPRAAVATGGRNRPASDRVHRDVRQRRHHSWQRAHLRLGRRCCGIFGTALASPSRNRLRDARGAQFLLGRAAVMDMAVNCQIARDWQPAQGEGLPMMKLQLVRRATTMPIASREGAPSLVTFPDLPSDLDRDVSRRLRWSRRCCLGARRRRCCHRRRCRLRLRFRLRPGFRASKLLPLAGA